MMISHSKKPFAWKRGTLKRGREDCEIYFRGRPFAVVRWSFFNEDCLVLIPNQGIHRLFSTLAKAQEFCEGRIWQIVLKEQSDAVKAKRNAKATNFTKHLNSYQEASDALDNIPSINPIDCSFLNDLAEL